MIPARGHSVREGLTWNALSRNFLVLRSAGRSVSSVRSAERRRPGDGGPRRERGRRHETLPVATTRQGLLFVFFGQEVPGSVGVPWLAKLAGRVLRQVLRTDIKPPDRNQQGSWPRRSSSATS